MGLEESLDVEWAHAIAPAANIILFEANDQGGATMAESPDLNTAVKTAASYPGVSVVSMSWGCVEDSSDPAYNATFTTPAGHQGVTFLAAAAIRARRPCIRPCRLTSSPLAEPS